MGKFDCGVVLLKDRDITSMTSRSHFQIHGFIDSKKAHFSFAFEGGFLACTLSQGYRLVRDGGVFGPASSRGECGSVPIWKLPPPLCSELWPTQGTWGGSPLVSLKGTVGSSHIFRLLLVPCPHFPEDARDTTGSASCQR